MVSTKRLPPALCVPKDSFPRETAGQPLGDVVDGSAVLGVPREQFLLTAAHLGDAGVAGLQFREGTLQADELGALGIAMLLQPVGEDQPWRVIVGRLDNRLQEDFSHGGSFTHPSPRGRL
jgi:hypothetical protein